MSLLHSRGAAAFPIACAGDITARGDITAQPGLVSGLLPWAGTSQEPAERLSKAQSGSSGTAGGAAGVTTGHRHVSVGFG